ncbi:MAG: hypothetical protein EU529_03900 [Promethearchaeota archaeon]|nr:MAG: hypothetical protein EU529_03900 [Candidatus Lokiarchaeota archaeon]
MLNSKFEDLKLFLKGKKILITTHDLVDIDGLASCVVLKFFLNRFIDSSDIHLFLPEISKSTKDFIQKYTEKFPDITIPLEIEFKTLKIDIFLILDTNNLDQVAIPDINSSEIPIIFIDHHLNLKKNNKRNISLKIIDDQYSSTAEIIYELCEYFNLELTLPYKYLLIAAILTDSGFFKHGNNDTILRISKLLSNQLDYQEILSTLKNDKTIPEKIAKIKALQRVKLIQEGNWLIGITNVGSFEASVASSLIKIGFDVSVAYSEKKSGYRISTRAKKYVCLKTGLHLGKILKEVSEECGASGGGHDGAAALNGILDLEIIIEKILDRIKQVLNK